MHNETSLDLIYFHIRWQLKITYVDVDVVVVVVVRSHHVCNRYSSVTQVWSAGGRLVQIDTLATNYSRQLQTVPNLDRRHLFNFLLL